VSSCSVAGVSKSLQREEKFVIVLGDEQDSVWKAKLK
jgi:hypothetical protein